MKALLLDTHAFLWWSLEPERLSPGLLTRMSDPEVRVVLSTVSSWETQIKVGLGKLVLKEPLRDIIGRELEVNGWEILPVKLSHTWKLAELAPLHRDPFVAQYPGVSVYWE